jgi:hypothetical protein
MTAGVGGQRTGPFMVTKEHRRFTECAHAICTHRTIGVCFGPAGVGTTLSARRHATGIWLNRCSTHGGHASPPMHTCMLPWRVPGQFSIPQPSAAPGVNSGKTCIC